LNGVAAGNFLAAIQSYYRGSTTGIAPSTPTDTNGTFSIAKAPTPLLVTFGGGDQDIGTALWYEENAASGTHTVTFQTVTSGDVTVAEFSGLATSSSLDNVGNNAQAEDAGTSQVTGTSGTTAQADELAIIGITMGAAGGSGDVGWTDPPTNHIKIGTSIWANDFSGLAGLHAYRILTSVGTYSGTFNWTYSELEQGRQALIQMFKAAAAGGAGVPGSGRIREFGALGWNLPIGNI